MIFFSGIAWYYGDNDFTTQVIMQYRKLLHEWARYFHEPKASINGAQYCTLTSVIGVSLTKPHINVLNASKLCLCMYVCFHTSHRKYIRISIVAL